MVRKRKKWTRRILSLMLAATLSISAFSGFYRPAYAEESIVQEVSTEDLPTNETEATEDSSEDSEVVRDEQLINPMTTEEVTEAVTEVITEAATEEIIESNPEIQSLDAEPEIVHDEQTVDPEDEEVYEDDDIVLYYHGDWEYLNTTSDSKFQELCGMNKQDFIAMMYSLWNEPIPEDAIGIPDEDATEELLLSTVALNRTMLGAPINDSGILQYYNNGRVGFLNNTWYTNRFTWSAGGESGQAYCYWAEKNSPPTGECSYSIIGQDTLGKNLASAIYLAENNASQLQGWWNDGCAGIGRSAGWGFNMENDDDVYCFTHLITSYFRNSNVLADIGASNYGSGDLATMMAVMASHISGYSGTPNNFRVYNINVRLDDSSSYQNLLFGNYIQAEGKIQVNKQAGNISIQNAHPDYYNLDGAVYGVYNSEANANADTNRVATLTISGGNATSGDLDTGTYYVKEVTAPRGYMLDPEIYTAVVRAGATTTVTSVDQAALSQIAIQKVSGSPDITNGNSYYSLSGAEYQVYTDAACTVPATAYTVSTTGSATGEMDAILTTTEDGSSNILFLARDLYYVKEVSASSGYRLDPEVYTVDLRTYDSTDPYQIQSSEPISANPVTLIKVSSNTTVTANNRMYSLAGAEYQVYTDAACTTRANAILYNAAGEITGTTNALLTTTADGTTNTLYLAKGIYYVKETKASPGYTLDRAVKQVDLRNYTSDDPYEVTSTEKPVGDPAELVLTKTDSEGVTMVRAGADGSAITSFGNATLEGAVFKVSYYDDLYDSDSISGKTPKAVWYIQTKYDDNYGEYRARLLQDYLSPDYTSSDFYIIDNRVEFPLGTVTFEEFRPASGYKNLDEGGVMTHAGGVAADNMTIMQIRMNGTSASAYVENPATNEYTTNADGTRIHVFTTAQDGSEISVKEEIKRSDLAFQKLNYVTYRPMANVFFRITSSTGESHIIKTDANGYFTSDSAEISHLTNTNGYDDIYQVEDDSAALALGDCGIWFYGTDDQTEWNAALIDDDKGAFRYDENYILQELPCTANRGMQMLPPVTVSLTRDNRLTFAGSYTNVPVPEIHTLEWDEFFGEGSHTSVVQDGVVSAIHDTVDYKYLTENTTYTFKTILMELDEDGELVGPLLDAEGNMILANTVITTPASETASTQSLCGTVDVKLEVVASAENNTLKDKRFVIFEYLYEGNDQELIEVDAAGNPVPGNTVAEHADSTDENQIGYFLDIHTNVFQDVTGDNQGVIKEEMHVSDLVTYKGLDTMSEYRLEAALKIVDFNGNEIGNVLDADGNPITAVKYLIPDDHDGVVQVDFPIFDGYQILDDNGLTIGNLVAYETLYLGRRKLVDHVNPTDEDQTLHVVQIRTTATDDETEDHVGYADEDVTIKDAVYYENLLPGRSYTISGVLMNAETGEKILDMNGNPVTATDTFTAATRTGTRDLYFSFNGADISGTKIVVFEDLYYKNIKLAAHADLTDDDQSVEYPKIGTKLTDQDSNKTVNTNGQIILIDEVSYKDLLVGKEYTMSGVLMNAETGKPVLAGGAPLTAEVSFMAEQSTGSIEVPFAFNLFETDLLQADGHCSDVVAFEDLYYEDIKIATHADLNDDNQTIKVTSPVSVELLKVDPDGKTLSGAKFELYRMEQDSFTLVDTYMTGEDGKIVLNDVEYGKYYFVETEAPKGYSIVTNTYSFEISKDTVDQKIITITALNKPDTPKTGDHTPVTAAAVIGLLALMILLFELIRKKKGFGDRYE
ncbi:MAG: VaFE repeat-containing surface-anchored protein [Lachnospiraceae bacterium]|nr:VaFE repeat-containing surface-anchored protein [Lachnospiraceae bacterium]